MSVLDNVTLPLRIAGVPRAERKRRGMAALEQLELADKAKNKATELSGGQKQRVVIARALVNNPSVIFAYEPIGNLDSATGRVVEDILLDLNKSAGITLIASPTTRISPSAAIAASTFGTGWWWTRSSPPFPHPPPFPTPL